MKRYAFGVDIGGTTTKIGLVNLVAMEVVSSRNIKTVNGDHSDTFTRICNTVRVIQSEEGITNEEVERIGIGTLGSVIDGRFVLSVKGFHWDNHFDLKAEVMKYFDWNVFIENDVNVISVGEYALRRDNVQDVVTIAIGTDIGVGIVLDGRLYSGKSGTAGEIAHIQLDPTQRVCEECKMNGCASVLCGGENIIKSFNLDSNDIKITTVEELYRYANDGVEIAVEHRDMFHKNLAKVVRMLHSILDPELIVIAGGVSLAGEGLREGVMNNLNAKGTEFLKRPVLELSLLGNESGVLGAALLRS